MFKSIGYRLYLYIFLLIIATAISSHFLIAKEYLYFIISTLFVCISIIRLYTHYNKFNQNILFLLNALENGDYSFHFSETKLSKREKELNVMMNRIKDILSNARQEVIKNEKFLSLIIQKVPTGIIILDEKNNIKETNDAVKAILGMSILTHLNQLSIIDTSLPHIFRELNEKKQIKISNDRDENLISLHVSNIKLKSENLKIITLNSIGNELEAREIESWIKLIRVMTHEIMNSIAPITSLTEMLLHSYQSKYEKNESNDIINNTIDALATINSTAKGLTVFVESYREFSGVSKPSLSTINLHNYLESILRLETVEIESKNVKILIQEFDKQWNIEADNNQLKQVIINLLKNALEAVNEDCPNSEIKITIDRAEKTKIHLANNGLPISEDVLDNIFVPFFTTKKSGTGIGLSVSRYIMRLHGGNLKHSYADGWTIFTIII